MACKCDAYLIDELLDQLGASILFSPGFNYGLMAEALDASVLQRRKEGKKRPPFSGLFQFVTHPFGFFEFQWLVDSIPQLVTACLEGSHLEKQFAGAFENYQTQ